MRWVSLEAILAIHEAQLELFGGASGIRDAGMIASALARPHNKAAYEDAPLDQLAAAYLFGFAKYHGFVDGNKRIAFLAADTFLRINGYEIHATQPDIIALMLSVAAGEMDEPFISGWIAEHRRKLKSTRKPPL
jgi:death on curing protein